MKVVIVESPFEGDTARNEAYARRCVKDCIDRGEAPFASHLLYTQPGVLRDDLPEERRLGIAAGLAVAERADLTVVYTDLGISQGMEYGIDHAEQCGRPVEYRTITPWCHQRASKAGIGNATA
jgi:hypothetical protein